MAYLDAKVFDTDEPGFQALNPHFDGRDGFGMRMEWPDYGKGGKLALYMMQQALQLGGGVSFEDFLEINKVPFIFPMEFWHLHWRQLCSLFQA